MIFEESREDGVSFRLEITRVANVLFWHDVQYISFTNFDYPLKS